MKIASFAFLIVYLFLGLFSKTENFAKIEELQLIDYQVLSQVIHTLIHNRWINQQFLNEFREMQTCEFQ